VQWLCSNVELDKRIEDLIDKYSRQKLNENYHLIFQSEEKARPVSNKELEAKQRAREARSAMRERRNLTDMINQVRN
jgi:hypothetical protein